jgi:hypothetical protein
MGKSILLFVLCITCFVVHLQLASRADGFCDPNFNLDTESKDEMMEYGKQMKRNGVSHIYFVHGTWAGNSPFGVIARLPGIPITIKKELEKVVKKQIDVILGDLGNYTESYIELFKKSIDNDISCSPPFQWGSGNYHSARVRGAIRLIKELAKNIKNPSENKRILLIGHSHAGQLFALLTTFLEDEEMLLLETDEKMSKIEKLVNVVGLDEEIYKNIAQLKEDIKKIDKVYLDIVTFGTPPRYHWGKSKTKSEGENYRLLNIINHRHETVSILGLLNTKGGDYVQQWGVGGTDTDLAESEKNREIEKIIGREQYYISLESVLKGNKRHKPNYGKTLLIDYGDEGKNLTESLLGHGAYTCKEKMLFNTKLIVKEFYRD